MSLFADGVRIAKAKSKKTNKDIATFTGMSNGAISKILSGSQNTSFENVEKICGALGFMPSQVYMFGEIERDEKTRSKY